MNNLPLVGISSCLMGNKVRYDGKDKFNQTAIKLVAPYVNLLPLCPESMAGLGIPRPPVNLVQTHQGIQALGRKNTSLNATNKITNMALVIANTYPNLKGFICQSRSPSCGYHTTPIYTAEKNEIITHEGSGLFINTLKNLLPDLVILNENELNEANAKTFLEQVLN